MRDRKPRVLVLSSTFPRWKDDTEPRFVLDLCRHLSEHADIKVLAPHTLGSTPDEVIEGIHVRRFRYFITRWEAVAYQGGITVRLRDNPWRLLQLPLFFIGMWWLSIRIIREWKPDVLHAHWIIPQGLVACLAARSRIPVVCTSHGGDLHALNSFFFRSLKRWTLKRCTCITVVSESMVQRIHDLVSSASVSVIPMGTDLKLFTPPRDPSERRGNEIVFVGRLVEKKGLPVLITAFSVLRDTRPDLKLTIVGDGPMRTDTERLVADLQQESSVEWLGSVQQKELPAIYRRATIAAFPFIVAKDGDQEGFGLVIAEAMGCGCPVIASDIPAVRSSIEPGVTGILTHPGDPVSLAEALRCHLSDEERRDTLARYARKSVSERFDWPHIALLYSQRIEQCWRR